MIIPQIIYATLCVLFAYFNSEWIKADKPINHKLNGEIHLAAWIICSVFFDWRLIFVLPFIGKTFFDLSLNLFRRLPLSYLSFPSQTSSKLDNLEYELFEGNGVKAKITYSLVIVICNMFYWYVSR